MINGAVSPTARATPRIAEVIRPPSAVGSTTRRVVFHSLAPSASEASREPVRHQTEHLLRGPGHLGSIEIEIASDAANPLQSCVTPRIHVA